MNTTTYVIPTSRRRRTIHRYLVVMMGALSSAKPVMAQSPPGSTATEIATTDSPAPPLPPLTQCAALEESSSTPSSAPIATSPDIPADASVEIEAGRTFLKISDYEAALDRFKHAKELSHGHPATLEWIIYTQKQRHRYSAMLEEMNTYVGNPDIDPVARRNKCVAAAALDQYIGALRVVVDEPRTTITLDGAKVVVDQKPPLDVLRVDGERDVELRVTKPGFKPFVWKGSVHGGRERTVRVTLEREVHEGTVAIAAGPGDFIRRDGMLVGLSDWEGTTSSGPHSVRVTAPGKIPFTTDILVSDGLTRTLSVTLEPRIPGWVWGLGGLLLAGGAAAGAAVLFEQAPITGRLGFADLRAGGR